MLVLDPRKEDIGALREVLERTPCFLEQLSAAHHLPELFIPWCQGNLDGPLHSVAALMEWHWYMSGIGIYLDAFTQCSQPWRC
jgi:hypothetical protein